MFSVALVTQVVLIAVGASLVTVAGARWRRIPASMRFHTIFRRVVVGLIPLIAGIGWLLGWPALIAVALIVGFGEVLECSIDIAALDAQRRSESPLKR